MTARQARDTSPDQADVVAFLLRPEVHGGAQVRHIETHLSHLFLVGDRAFKMKKAVSWSMVDYATVERREHFCRKELGVNGPVAGALYIGVIPVTQGPSGLVMGGEGPPVEWLVEMRRFDDRSQLDQMVEDGTLSDDIVDATADAIAGMHRSAPIVSQSGAADRALALAQQLATDTAAQTITTADEAAAARRWLEKAREAIARKADVIDRRARHGFVRRCHADLHLSNICMFEGRPTPFDAIEFSDEIATIDVLYDFAFVLIDLESHERADLSARLLSRYLEWTRDYSGLALLPLFLSLRAMVRALTGAAKGRSPATHITAATRTLTGPAGVWLAAVGGLSGSGKSTVARALGACSGAAVIRSDTARKHLFGVAPTERLSASAYAPHVSERVYARMLQDARRGLRAGWPMVTDATFMEPASRERVAALAAREGVPFVGAWLNVPSDVMRERVRRRRGDASDADEAVVAAQEHRDLGRMDWHELDGTAAPDENAAEILKRARTG